MTTTEQAEALADVQRWAQVRIDAEGKRDAAILAALKAGVGPTEIARAAGLTRGRIYQIRDGRR
jgi:DNA-binding phage protein